MDAHTPLRPTLDLDAIFCLEESRRLGKDWVVRYHNRALQVTVTRAAQRHVGPGGEVLVCEDRVGRIRIVVHSRASGREQELTWTPIDGTVRRPASVPVAPPPRLSPAAPAGYTRSGKPLSAAQMAVRAHWSRQVPLPKGPPSPGLPPPAHA